MAQHRDTHDPLVTRDTTFDAADGTNLQETYTLDEIEDLLYGDDRSAHARLAKLRELRDDAAMRESGDWGGQDPAAALSEIDRAIDELSAMIANSDETETYAELAPTLNADPNERLDALSPDDEDTRHAIEGDENEGDGEDDDLGPLDVAEWDEGDDFRPEKGVH